MRCRAKVRLRWVAMLAVTIACLAFAGQAQATLTITYEDGTPVPTPTDVKLIWAPGPWEGTGFSIGWGGLDASETWEFNCAVNKRHNFTWFDGTLVRNQDKSFDWIVLTGLNRPFTCQQISSRAGNEGEGEVGFDGVHYWQVKLMPSGKIIVYEPNFELHFVPGYSYNVTASKMEGHFPILKKPHILDMGFTFEELAFQYNPEPVYFTGTFMLGAERYFGQIQWLKVHK